MLKSFRAVILYHICGLIFLSVLLGYIIFRWNFFFIPVGLGVAIFALAIHLLRYVEKKTDELSRFLLSLREGIYMDAAGGTRTSLPDNVFGQTLQEVTREFAKVSTERELHFQYLQTLNENIGVGIISFSQDGTARMVNKSAKTLLNIYHFTRFDDFRKVSDLFYESLSRMRPEQRELLSIKEDGQEIQLAVHRKDLVLQNEMLRIFLFQNINAELDQKEIETWHKLIRILTHEIMNSVTPITSLSRAVQSIIRHAPATTDLSALKPEQVEDIHTALETIVKRGDGLMKFIKSYRAFTLTTKLDLQRVDVIELVRRSILLLAAELHARNISIDFIPPQQQLFWFLDVVLVEQVMINLLKNSMEAVEVDGSGFLKVSILYSSEQLTITVVDNGKGMDEETVSKIFTPFFTTKPNGTGVGLSFVKQIMKLHKGTIKVKSSVGSGTLTELKFPKLD